MANMTNVSSPLGIHWVPILDAGIGTGDPKGMKINSSAAIKGQEMNVFIKSNR